MEASLCWRPCHLQPGSPTSPEAHYKHESTKEIGRSQRLSYTHKISPANRDSTWMTKTDRAHGPPHAQSCCWTNASKPQALSWTHPEAGPKMGAIFRTRNRPLKRCPPTVGGHRLGGLFRVRKVAPVWGPSFRASLSNFQNDCTLV